MLSILRKLTRYAFGIAAGTAVLSIPERRGEGSPWSLLLEDQAGTRDSGLDHCRLDCKMDADGY